MAHTHTAFATLTYRPKEIPCTSDGLPTLTPRDLSLWLKRFRKEIEPLKIRYYGVGEYGERRGLPHFHVILFGYQGCAYGKSRYADGRTIDCCHSCDRIRDTWGKGIIQCEPMSPGLAGYISGYITKGLRAHDTRLNGRHPEFSRCSLQNGGIGHCSVENLARVSKQRLDAGITDDVAKLVRLDGAIAPIGKYLTVAIRKALGGDGKAPESVVKQMEAEMLPLLARSRVDPQAITLKQQVRKNSAGKIASLHAQQAMNIQKRKRNETF